MKVRVNNGFGCDERDLAFALMTHAGGVIARIGSVDDVTPGFARIACTLNDTPLPDPGYIYAVSYDRDCMIRVIVLDGLDVDTDEGWVAVLRLVKGGAFQCQEFQLRIGSSDELEAFVARQSL